MATSQIVAVSNSYRQHKKQNPRIQIVEEKQTNNHNINCCNHNNQQQQSKVEVANQKSERSYCCSSCCCFILSSDEESSYTKHQQQQQLQHTEHLNRRKNIKGQKENYKTIHKAKEVNERTMDINRNGSLRNRVSFICLFKLLYLIISYKISEEDNFRLPSGVFVIIMGIVL